MRILLISGHGAGDPGAIGNGYKEADITMEVVQKMAPLLSAYADVTVYPVERNAFQDVKNGKWQVGWNYDYVFEVHFNAGGGTGTEIYVTKKEKGTSVEQKVLNNLQLFYRNRGVKIQDFLVINTAKNKGVSSALLEVCFIDSQSDMEMYQKSKDRISASIVAGIVDGFGLAGKKNASTSTTSNTNVANNSSNNVLTTNYKGGSIVEALNSVRVDSSFNNRKKLAEKNQITNYKGTAQQNVQMLNLLKQGKLKK